MSQYYDMTKMADFIKQYAASIGMDPSVALKVARSEGLAPGVWQAGGELNYGRERSYGPFQLHVAPEGSKYYPGLGNRFEKDTNLDASDPKNAFAAAKYAMDEANKSGWGQWFGAKRVGVGQYEGIGGKPQGDAPDVPSAIASPEGQPYAAFEPPIKHGLAGQPYAGFRQTPSSAPPNSLISKLTGSSGFTPKSPMSMAASMGSGIIGALAGLFGGGGGQAQAAPAPMPMIQAGRDPGGELPKMDYFAEAEPGIDPEEEKRKKLMAALGG